MELQRSFIHGLALVVAVSSIALSACKEADELVDATNVTTPSSTPTPASQDYPLFLKVETTWETDEDNSLGPTTHANCTVPDGSAAGTTVACTANIPEGQLYYSNIKFTMGTNSPVTCSRLVFQPYYYKASVSATFRPFWSPDADIDCSGATAEAGATCYNGVATEIVPEFPKFRAVYFMTEVQAESSFTAKSGNKQSAGSNRWTSNNLLLADRGANIAIPFDGYRANTFVDYSVICRDKWEEPIWEIDLTINDVDSTVDHIETWAEWP